MAPAFPRVQAAAIDGRYENVFHRQVQLERLCKAVSDNVEEIKKAIASDSGSSPAEVAVEYHETLSAVKRDYATLDHKAALEQEYLIANGQMRRIGGSQLELLPLSAALAAGNVVILLLENKLRAVPSLLRKLLSEALDADGFAIASKPVQSDELPKSAMRVLQSGIEGSPRANQLTSAARAPVLAVVDRTANVQHAAQEIVAARSSFCGSSPYAPDVVLVNEFAKKDFLQAVISAAIEIGHAPETKGKTLSSTEISHPTDLLRKSDRGLRVVSREKNFAVVELSSRDAVLSVKLPASVLAVYAIKSWDDAIDLIGSRTTKPLLAAYHFSHARTGKYLSQFIASEASFVNHVPRELLLGPPAVSGRQSALGHRYSIDSFTISRPVQIKASSESVRIAGILATSSSDVAQKLITEAASPLKAFKRNPGGGIGYFEQVFLLGAGLTLARTLTVSATGVYWFLRWGRPL
ncbi:hypothetical protein CBER1_00250 [Cercospora berteroae]|uniref:Aldehyde dehydrogenase domain-containing protein n=1 Tax=Cercospora berteroae TaxID=357750 RepID=A0A2S6CDJ6_9PEZI|nr:hypothetical protein CBER1_00250 [Cercospora berteroae]